ncbi:MAG: sulfite exporter TauE/SafE family protein [Clostridia bacterium]|nr:sulfite exporter TauE/SafE family protein [Clostridia bacterium]
MMMLVCFLIAILVGMGIGGGGFLVIYLTLCMNYPQLIAQGTNLLFFLIAGFSSLLIHLRKRKLNLKRLLPIILFSIPGTLIGSYLANTVDPKIPRIVLGILLILSGGQTAFKVVYQIIKEKKKKISKKHFTK